MSVLKLQSEKRVLVRMVAVTAIAAGLLISPPYKGASEAGILGGAIGGGLIGGLIGGRGGMIGGAIVGGVIGGVAKAHRHRRHRRHH